MQANSLSRLPSGIRAASDRTQCTCYLYRYEDNFDAVNNLSVISQNTDKSDITGYGTPDKFLESVQYLFGKQTFTGATRLALMSLGGLLRDSGMSVHSSLRLERIPNMSG